MGDGDGMRYYRVVNKDDGPETTCEVCLEEDDEVEGEVYDEEDQECERCPRAADP